MNTSCHQTSRRGRGSGRQWLLLMVATFGAWFSGVCHAEEQAVEGADVLEVLVAPDRNRARRAQTETYHRHRERPGDLSVALDYTRRCIEAFRAESDPRHLSYAEAALGSWWGLESPPPEVRLWRATIRQSRHHFVEARRDLEALTRERPELAQGWLTLSTVLVVMGEVEEARTRCQPLRALAGDYVFTVADAGVASLAGEGEVSRQRLVDLLAGPPPATPGLRAWACGTLADICERLGRGAEAETYFRAARLLARDDPYPLTVLADFLLAEGRFREAEELVRPHRENHGLLLRWARAKARLGEWDGMYVDAVVSLRSDERAAAARGEQGHAREEAILNLELLDEPAEALKLAVRNWQVQREPADARLLVACALAARQPAAAASVLAWRSRFGSEDVVLDRLFAALNALP